MEYPISQCLIYLLMSVTMGTKFLLFNGLQSAIIIIYFNDQIVLNLVNENPFKLASVAFVKFPSF